MPSEHFFSFGAGAQVWPISHSPVSWHVHLLMSCQMVCCLLMWQHAGSSVFAYMALRSTRVYGTWSGFETRVGLELVADLGAIVRIYMDTSFDSLRTRRVAHGCSQPPSLVTPPAGFCAVVYFSKKKTSPLQKKSPLFFVPDFISYLLDPAMKVHQKK